MRLKLIEKSGRQVLSLAEVRSYLRASLGGEEDVLKSMIAATHKFVEEQVGVSLTPQVWQQEESYTTPNSTAFLLSRSNKKHTSSRLLKLPVIKVREVWGGREGGALKKLAEREYQLIEYKVVLKEQVAAVKIIYEAGFEETPAPLKLAMLQMIGELYENRDLSPQRFLRGDHPVWALLKMYGR